MDERLEEIKEVFGIQKMQILPDRNTILFSIKDIGWLIQQAELADLLVTDKSRVQLEKRVEELEKENKELHQEIGKHANQVFEIANASFKTGEQAKQLINEMMLKGESQ